MTWNQAAEAAMQFVKGAPKFSRSDGEYCKIMYEFLKVFSKRKNNLGGCDLVQYEIHLKDKALVYITVQGYQGILYC